METNTSVLKDHLSVAVARHRILDHLLAEIIQRLRNRCFLVSIDFRTLLLLKLAVDALVDTEQLWKVARVLVGD